MPTAAVDCVLSCPTKAVSTILYRLVTSILITVGSESSKIKPGMGASVRWRTRSSADMEEIFIRGRTAFLWK